jgi:outer membrane protein TolC
MNKQQWKKAYHLARLSTCIEPKVNAEQAAEVKAFNRLHQMIKSGLLARTDFRAAAECVRSYRYSGDRLDPFHNRFKGLKHQMFAYGNRSNECR